MKRSWTMRRRLMLAFAGFTLFVAMMFSAIAVLFLYLVEDRFFSDALQHEAKRQIAFHQQSNHWAIPRSEFMAIHETLNSFPVDLRTPYLAEPTRSEFAGQSGRHYHLLRLRTGKSDAIDAFLVAEVSQQLVVRRMRSSILEFLIWSVSLVVLIALGLGLWLARRIAAPLVELAQLVEAMQPEDPVLESGRLFRAREVDVLSQGLASLTRRIHSFVEREREFTSDVSHELRTPLAVVLSGCERLEHDPSLSVTARRQISFIKQSSWQMQQCATTLLSLAREEHLVNPAQALAVLPIIEQVILEQGHQLEGKPVDVMVTVDPTTQMRIAPTVLHILLGNLVGNAFAHTERGQVLVDVRDERLRITNSRVVNPAELDAFFEPFAKGEASAGFGLGLAIVRRLCNRYGIDLRIESVAEGTRASLALEPGDHPI